MKKLNIYDFGIIRKDINKYIIIDNEGHKKLLDYKNKYNLTKKGLYILIKNVIRNIKREYNTGNIDFLRDLKRIEKKDLENTIFNSVNMYIDINPFEFTNLIIDIFNINTFYLSKLNKIYNIYNFLKELEKNDYLIIDLRYPYYYEKNIFTKNDFIELMDYLFHYIDLDSKDLKEYITKINEGIYLYRKHFLYIKLFSKTFFKKINISFYRKLSFQYYDDFLMIKEIIKNENIIKDLYLKLINKKDLINEIDIKILNELGLNKKNNIKINLI